MKRKSLKAVAIVVAVFLVILSFSMEAQAIPAFARKYKTSCATCHEAFPRLNGVGEAFRLNGFKFTDDELYIKDEPVEMGDEAYKRLWPEAIWPTDIPGLPPLSVVLRSDARIDSGETRDARTEFLFPSQVKLLGAGAFGDDMSFFVELAFNRVGSDGGGHGGHGGSESEEGTETDVMGWVQFEDLFSSENVFNLRVGTVGMQEMGLFTARDHNRFTINPYLYSSWTMPTPTAHNIAHGIDGITDHDDIDFDGNPFMIHAQPGIEVNGFGRNWRYALGVTNGNGDGVGDNNSEKDAYVQLAYKIGGIGFDGSTEEGQAGLDSPNPWVDDSLTFSLFGYYGRSPIKIEREDDGYEEETDDEFWRCGPGVLWRKKNLQLGSGYIFGNNDKPYGALSDEDVESSSWFVEAHYFAKPWLIPYVRYETLKLDLPSELEDGDEASFPDGVDQGRVIVGAKMLIRANVSLGIEGRFYTENDNTDETEDSNQLIASLVVAF